MFKTQIYLKQAVYYNMTVLPLTIHFFHTSQKSVANKYGLIKKNAPCFTMNLMKAEGKVQSLKTNDSVRSPNIHNHRRTALPERGALSISACLKLTLSWNCKVSGETT